MSQTNRSASTRDNFGETNITEVWASNVKKQLLKIKKLTKDQNCKFVGLDTEYPGVAFKSNKYGPYEQLKINVDALKLIQLGLSLMDPTTGRARTWQFNFHFDKEKDMSCKEAMEILTKSGIDFSLMKNNGIDPRVFADYFMEAGLVQRENLTWIAFQGRYDFAYLMKTILYQKLPGTPKEASKLQKDLFPVYYDLKYICKNQKQLSEVCAKMKGQGLSHLAEHFKVKRVGSEHQAGSDSLMTVQVFSSIVKWFREKEIDLEVHCGKIYLDKYPVIPETNYTKQL